MNFIKAIIIIILTLLSLNLLLVIAVHSGDFFSSRIPGWRTNIIPYETKLVLTLTLNIILPIYFMLKFKLTRNFHFVCYLFTVNFLCYLGYWLKQHINNHIDIDVGQYLKLVHQTFWLGMTIHVLHIIFYCCLLIRMRKKE